MSDDLPHRSASHVPCNSGVAVLDAHRCLVEVVGDDVVERALAQLPAKIVGPYREALAVSWIPISTVEAVYEAVSKEANRAVLEIQAEATRRGVERSLHGAWRMLIRFTSDEALVRRTGAFYARAFDVGTLTSEIPKPGRVVLHLRDFPRIPDFSLRSLAWGIETVMTVAGRKNVVITFARTPDGARFDGRWDAR